MDIIELDGSYMEGGGQIVRTALALSTITGKPFRVTGIRKGRKQPGLKNQHLYCIEALKQICNAEVKGAELGSESIEYRPGRISRDRINIDIGTAGSITLMMQAILLPSLFAGKQMRMKITGGTDVRWSMPFDFLDKVVIPHYRCLADIDMRVARRGYYPKGGGKVDIKIRPKFDINDYPGYEEMLEDVKGHVKSIEIMEKGKLTGISGISHASDILKRAEVAERTAKEAKNILVKAGVDADIKSEYVGTLSPGSGITLIAEFANCKLGADSLGEKGKPSETVGREAAEKMLQEIGSGAAADRHTADNLIPLLALVGGRMHASEITPHTLTNIYTVEKFLDVKFRTEGNIIFSETSDVT